MRVLVFIITGFVIAGCGTITPLAELEQQALLTGDWSAVEKRERMLQRREVRKGNACPAGRVAVCDSFAGVPRCTCIESDDLQAILAGHEF